VKVFVAIMAVLTAALGAQEGMTLEIPPAPERGIHDHARVFSASVERLVELENRIESTAELSGVKVYVALFDTLIGRSLPEELANLQEAWLGDEVGVLLVLECDSGRWLLAWSDGGAVSSEGMPAVPVVRRGAVPGPEQLRIEQNLRELGPPKQRSVDDISRLVTTLIDGVETAVAEEARPGGWTKEVVVMVVGLLAALLLAAMLGWAWVKRNAKRAKERLIFPEVSISRRLGAPYGGGKITTRRFRGVSS
jgi:hypothetical protein